ncbi:MULTISPECIES: histidine phosphatase family protein [unclassified Brevibacterium]|uniref:histidine phosphatase family protein n=1 Tax=unclassified Brevibacterium TaxID=2614124 RepID=UPI001E35AC59|nr:MULTISPECIES: histidine phosphatase family protein [unclassified Brevibacterium]MCD1284711.1 histidine phosphatase family protein [Brevibacterium sp. CCUG 69071]MDK8435670.1 histidine phosphatase family protein [Brevibacterium sp. H-BE7]
MTKTVIFWRHGQTDFNVAGRFQGQSDVPLNDLGRAQAAETAQNLQHLHPELIVSSDLSRAAETADHLAELLDLEPVRDARLRETAFGDWEGSTRAEVAENWAEELAAWAAGADISPPGGESRSQSGQRVAEAIVDLVYTTDAETIAIVAHGAVLRGAAEILLGLTGSGRLAVLGNCGHGEFGFTGENWVLRSWGTRPAR